MNRPSRPTYRSRVLHPSRPRCSRQISPFQVIVITVAGLAVVSLVILGIWLLGSRGGDPDLDPTPGSTQQMIEATETPTSTPTVTTTPTPVPVVCETIRDTTAHNGPQQVSIKEPVQAGRNLSVYRQVSGDSLAWYEVDLFGSTRYILVEDMDCPVEP